MADFTTIMTGGAQVDDSKVLEFEKQFLLAQAEQGVADQFASMARPVNGESLQLTKYAHLALDTTPLNETEDVDSEALSDTKVVFAPKEYGKVVTTTKLASLQTNGKVDLAAARLVGVNAGRTQNKLAMLAMDGSTQGLIAANSFDEVQPTDVMTGGLMGKAYNLLARKNSIGVANGQFVMLAHDDVIHDLRESANWVDVMKYAQPSEILKNEVGMYKGMRVVRDNLATVATNSHASPTPVYNSYCIGFNAFGKGVSDEVKVKLTGPFDKLGRFVNVGWHGVLEYKIVEQEALVIIQTGSSVNAA